MVSLPLIPVILAPGQCHPAASVLSLVPNMTITSICADFAKTPPHFPIRVNYTPSSIQTLRTTDFPDRQPNNTDIHHNNTHSINRSQLSFLHYLKRSTTVPPLHQMPHTSWTLEEVV